MSDTKHSLNPFQIRASVRTLIHAHKDFVMEEFAEMAYAMADAMLKARAAIDAVKEASHG